MSDEQKKLEQQSEEIAKNLDENEVDAVSGGIGMPSVIVSNNPSITVDPSVAYNMPEKSDCPCISGGTGIKWHTQIEVSGMPGMPGASGSFNSPSTPPLTPFDSLDSFDPNAPGIFHINGGK